MLKVSPPKDAKILLKLLTISDEPRTLSEICKSISEKYNDGRIYKIKNDLIKLNILIPNGTKVSTQGRGNGIFYTYRVNKEIIAKIFFGYINETSILYNISVDKFFKSFFVNWDREEIKNFVKKSGVLIK